MRILTRCPIRGLRHDRVEQAEDHVEVYVREVEALNQLQRDSGLHWNEPHLVQRITVLGDRLKRAILSEVRNNRQPPVAEQPQNALVVEQWYVTLKRQIVAYLICILYWLLHKLIMHL